MKLHIDLETLQLIEAPGFRTPLTSLRLKRGDSTRMEVVFLEGGSVPVNIGQTSELAIRFGAKISGQFGSSHIIFTDAFEPVVPGGIPIYACHPNLNTTELNEALELGTATEKPKVLLMGEIEWVTLAGKRSSTRTFPITVENDVIRGDEGTPEALPEPEDWLSVRAIRHDTNQTLTDAERVQAYANLTGDQPFEGHWVEGVSGATGFSFDLIQLRRGRAATYQIRIWDVVGTAGIGVIYLTLMASTDRILMSPAYNIILAPSDSIGVDINGGITMVVEEGMQFDVDVAAGFEGSNYTNLETLQLFPTLQDTTSPASFRYSVTLIPN